MTTRVFLVALASPVANEDGFIHKTLFGIGKKIIGSLPVVGGVLETGLEIAGGLFGGDEAGTQGCPPGFIPTPTGCVPRGGTVAMERRGLGGAFGGAARRVREEQPRRAAPPRPRFEPIPTLGIGAPSGPNGRHPERPPVPTLAVTGQYGAGFEPSLISTEMLECPPGTILGKDEVCYNRRDLRNNERKWPRGRRPLLTGGEMRAISTAASAAKRLQKKQQQLRSLGLLKPLPRAKAPKMLAPGHHAHIAHDGQSQH